MSGDHRPVWRGGSAKLSLRDLASRVSPRLGGRRDDRRDRRLGRLGPARAADPRPRRERHPGRHPGGAGGRDVRLGGKRWRGAPSTVGMPGGRMALVTTIDVDLYLQGVVPLESPASWPLAALEAQAICARTFALAKRTLSRPYDVVAGEADQRWGGVGRNRRSRTRRSSRPAGGRCSTAAARPRCSTRPAAAATPADIVAAWNGQPLPYLRGVVTVLRARARLPLGAGRSSSARWRRSARARGGRAARSR